MSVMVSLPETSNTFAATGVTGGLTLLPLGRVTLVDPPSNATDDRNDTIYLSSIGCRLALRDIYDKVNFPQEDTVAAAAVRGTPMVNAPDRQDA